MTKKALVVLSGGQDSVTCLAIAVAAFGAPNVHAITFDYQQRHARELECAAQVAKLCGVADRHEIIPVGAGILAGKSPLTDHSQPLEQYASFEQMDKIIGNRVELTFVPMRNALFLTLAANRAAVLGATSIYTGVCQQDNANYPDCRADFIGRQQDAINFALGYEDAGFNVKPERISIETPLMHMSKAESIKHLTGLGMERLALLAFSHTAYDGQYPPLGNDHATVLRRQGFLEAGIPDPLMVRAWMEGRVVLEHPLGPDTGTWAKGGGSFAELCDAIITHKITLGMNR